MQNVGQGTAGDGPKIADKVVHHDIGNSPSTPHSTSNSSPAKSETETYSEHRRYMSDTSGSEDDSVSEVGSPQYLRSPEAQVSLHPERDILWPSVRPFICCFAFYQLFVNTDNYVRNPSDRGWPTKTKESLTGRRNKRPLLGEKTTTWPIVFPRK